MNSRVNIRKSTSKAIADLELTPEEQDAVDRLEARIRILDVTWGDSLNDFDAIARVILAARKTQG